MINERDERFMREALCEAQKALELGEIPVGAVIVCCDDIIAAAHNTRESQKTALGHAELTAISLACSALGGWRLSDCELFVTLEPCPMCAGAIINSRIKRVVYGASDAKAGCVHSVIDMFELPFNHHPIVKGGILEDECAAILSQFFSDLRKK